jgi:hypothetical protein
MTAIVDEMSDAETILIFVEWYALYDTKIWLTGM